MSLKQGSLSVKITGIKSMNVSVPIVSSKSSKNLTTYLELGLFIISKMVKCTFGKINDKIFLLSDLIVPKKSNCHTLQFGFW